jgi:hypothetical protein
MLCLSAKQLRQRKTLDKLAALFKINQQSDWYEVRGVEFKRRKIWFVRKSFADSIYNTLQTLYSEFTWHPWLFKHAPRKFWRNQNNQRKYFEWLEEELGIENKEQWYTVKESEVMERGGSSLFILYHRSLPAALLSVFPEYGFLPWKFSHIPARFWTDIKNQRRYFDWIADEHGIETQRDWYNLKLEDFQCESLMQQYDYSFIKALPSIYPEYTWHTWLFQKVPGGFWDEEGNVIQYLDWVTHRLNITSSTDWYKIPHRQLAEIGGATLLRHCKLPVLLAKYYPGSIWDADKFNERTKSQQQLLNTLHSLAPLLTSKSNNK